MPSQKLVIAFLISMGLPELVFSGECCKAHYSILGNYNTEKWCSNYCCIQLGIYDCCDNVLLQAPSYEREDFCSAYLRDNVWVDVVIALGLAAFVIVVCICICKNCCSNARYRGVVLPGQTGPGGVTVVNSQNSQMTQQHPGYPMHPPPGGNPA
uniref:Protein shisa-5-like n=1 Tax=Crassostrea virginica TaxID=6565 RepID=A0A8B8E5V8_CRAVI|nr:protein shisa-5-like [Crassostrea virginica]